VFLPLGREHLTVEEMDEGMRYAVGSRQSMFETETSQVTYHKSHITHQKPETWNLEPETVGDKPLVLIVEDNADLRLYIRGYLDEVYTVIEAKDGKQGLERAIKHVPDLIISDVMMPQMDGFELSGKLKSDERTSHIPVILLTARASTESKMEGLETGADDFLTKPFDPPELLVRVKNLIDQRKKLKEKYIRESGAGRFVVETKPSGDLLSMDDQFLKKVKTIVEKNLADSNFSVEEFASKMNLSRVQLHRKLKALIEMSASDYIRTLRLNKAAEMIAHKTANIAEIAYDVGFTNPSHFSESFKKQFGKLPSEFTL
jgi:DNA-binding response OmpR family regulator